MARRNRKSRQAKGTSGRNAKPTPEELQQEKSFFLWAAVITLVVVVLLYFLFLS